MTKRSRRTGRTAVHPPAREPTPEVAPGKSESVSESSILAIFLSDHQKGYILAWAALAEASRAKRRTKRGRGHRPKTSRLETLRRYLRRKRPRNALEKTATDRASIYLSDRYEKAVLSAVIDLANELDWHIEPDGRPEIGSWFARFKIRRNRDMKEKIAELAEKTERALELRYINNPRSESDEREANAVANVIKSLEGGQDAVIRLSSFVIVKHDGRIIATVLSEEQIRLLDKKPTLLRNPAEMFEALSEKSLSEPSPTAGDVQAIEPSSEAQ